MLGFQQMNCKTRFHNYYNSTYCVPELIVFLYNSGQNSNCLSPQNSKIASFYERDRVLCCPNLLGICQVQLCPLFFWCITKSYRYSNIIMKHILHEIFAEAKTRFWSLFLGTHGDFEVISLQKKTCSNKYLMF